MPEGTRPHLQVVLGHGASGTAASMAPWVEALTRRGFAAEAIELPRGDAERAVPVFRRRIEAAAGAESVVPGGHSFGGRVASIAATRAIAEGRRIAALVLLSYPLHRPGHPETWVARTGHWPALRLPVLLLSGESDPFARIDLLRDAVRLLPSAELVTYPGVGHGLAPVRDEAADRIATFLRGLDPRD